MDRLNTNYLIFVMNPLDLSKYLVVEGVARQDIAQERFTALVSRYPGHPVRLYTSEKVLIQESAPAA